MTKRLEHNPIITTPSIFLIEFRNKRRIRNLNDIERLGKKPRNIPNENICRNKTYYAVELSKIIDLEEDVTFSDNENVHDENNKVN